MRVLAIVTLLALFSSPALAAEDTAIKPIIPHEHVGEESCFQGTFAGKALDMTEWPSYAEQAEGKGTVTKLPRQAVSHVALHLTFTNGREARNETWDMDFTINVTSPSLKQELFAHSGCIWSGWDTKTETERSPPFKLGCSIDCDGGGFTAERMPGTRSLAVRFWDLAMQSGCEGGGRYRLSTIEPLETGTFRVDPAPLDACKPLKAWAAEEVDR